jgi:MFS transporter, putative metabolite:H+ symporter
MNVHEPPKISAAARLDRLPVFSAHRQMLMLLAFCFFFELGDLNTFAFAAPALLKQWGLTIDTIKWITAAGFVGMFAGATTGGWFADSVGRKRALMLSTAWFSVASLLNALAWEPVGLFVARLLTGVGLSAMTAIGITYIAEMFPARVRGTYQGYVMLIGLVGIPATAYVARFAVPAVSWGWRVVFLWGAIGMLFPLFARRLEESPRWYEKRGEYRKADAVLTRLERAAESEKGLLPAPIAQPQAPPRPTRFATLFAPHVRATTAMLTVAWIFQTVGFYGFSAWVPTLLVDHGFTLVTSLAWSSAMQWGGIPGALIAALVSDRWQRKWWVTIAALLIAACGLAYGLTFEALYIVVFGFLVTMFIQAFAPMLYAYTAECYPTEVRSSGTGFTYGVGRLANALGPLGIAFLYTAYGYQSVFVAIAACWAVVALIVATMGPRTGGKSL